MKNGNFFFIFLFFALCNNSNAEIKPYLTIDNSGLNKQERIEVIDRYLVDLAVSLKNMESKFDENSKRLKSLEDIVKVMKEVEFKKIDPRVGEFKTTPAISSKELSETEKLKADILVLKNQDIEKLKIELHELKDTVKAVQATIKSGQIK